MKLKFQSDVVRLSLECGALAALLGLLGLVGYSKWSQVRASPTPETNTAKHPTPPPKELLATTAPSSPQPDESWLSGVRRLR
jgi:hypothetical protein